MEILQGDIDRKEYYTIRETAQILGVTSKTVRNWIEKKQVAAVWNDIGKGKSHWLIAKLIVEDRLQEKSKNIVQSPTIIPETTLTDLADLIGDRLQNDFNELRQENAALRAEMETLRAEIRDQNTKLLEVVQQPWWKFWK